ncbi:hypothetical protein GM921_00635 [Pedobacter sp. LMG 31464]|uniref:Uncharacterized protein n=1 Tax=Pedobacter planticolens TaxID=2679964 RepID=A0A923DUA0_9SPHI|nr:hypothetical protein [Pedobacter planticolens]MBB2143976.1 hypothetical protein [Pedobacter planticolens]
MTPQEFKLIEKDIKRYLRMNKIRKVLHLQLEQTFDDFDKIINIWNVKTEKGAWWVAEGRYAPMNLYPQDAFYFSVDEVYSFHLGITQRLEKDHNMSKGILDEIPLDLEQVHEIRRKLTLAADKVHIGMEPEEMQAIGLTCREALIALGNELTKRNPVIVAEKELKKADFKGIAYAFIEEYAPDQKNATLRNHARKMTDMAWSYASEIVHSSHKNFPDVKICIIMAATTVSIFENLFMKYLGFDHDPRCPECGSMGIEVYHSKKEDELIEHCTKCEFDNVVKIESIHKKGLKF